MKPGEEGISLLQSQARACRVVCRRESDLDVGRFYISESTVTYCFISAFMEKSDTVHTTAIDGCRNFLHSCPSTGPVLDDEPKPAGSNTGIFMNRVTLFPCLNAFCQTGYPQRPSWHDTCNIYAATHPNVATPNATTRPKMPEQ